MHPVRRQRHFMRRRHGVMGGSLVLCLRTTLYHRAMGSNLLGPILLLGMSATLFGVARRGRKNQEAYALWQSGAVSGLCLALLGLFTLERSPPIWDSVVYFGMASKGGLFSGGTAPFCFRILVPAVAKALPLPLPAAFELLNQGCLWGAAMFVYSLLRRSGFSPNVALAGPCLLILSAFAKFVVWYRYGVDQLAILGITAVTWAIVARRFALSALLASIVVLGKESVLLLAPFLYGELSVPTGRLPPRVARLLVTVAWWLAPLLAFAILHWSIPCHAGSGVVATIVDWGSARFLSPKATCEMLLALPKTFGAVSLIILCEAKRVWPMVRARPHVFVAIIVILDAGIFGASDYERVYFLSLPLVLLVLMPLLEAIAPSPWQIAVFVLAQASLLDVFAKPDFMDLPRWFMVNTEWGDLALYALKVALWWIALRAVGWGAETPPRKDSQGDAFP